MTLLDTSFLIEAMEWDPSALAKARNLEGQRVNVKVPTPDLCELWRVGQSTRRIAGSPSWRSN